MASYRVFRKKLCFFPIIFSILSLLPPRWAVIGCTKYGQPIGVTVHSHNFGSLLQRYVDEGWVAVDWENIKILLNTLYVSL